jgi:hypothetical protein
LVAYPPLELDGVDIGQVIAMSFPIGSRRTNLRSAGSEVIQDQFVFSFNSGPVVIFAVCLHILVGGKGAFFMAEPEKSKHTYFTFCFLTRQPAISAHFLFLCCLALSPMGAVPIYDFGEMPPADWLGAESILNGLTVVGGIAAHAALKVPDWQIDRKRKVGDPSPVRVPNPFHVTSHSQILLLTHNDQSDRLGFETAPRAAHLRVHLLLLCHRRLVVPGRRDGLQC